MNKINATKNLDRDVYNIINKINEIIDRIESKHDPYSSVGAGIKGVLKPDKTAAIQIEIGGVWYEVSLTEIGRQ